MEKIKSENKINYWKEACDFAKTILPEDIEKRFIDECKKRKFNHNEKLFFRKMVADAVEFELTMAMLKGQCIEAETKQKKNGEGK